MKNSFRFKAILIATSLAFMALTQQYALAESKMIQASGSRDYLETDYQGCLARGAQLLRVELQKVCGPLYLTTNSTITCDPDDRDLAFVLTQGKIVGSAINPQIICETYLGTKKVFHADLAKSKYPNEFKYRKRDPNARAFLERVKAYETITVQFWKATFNGSIECKKAKKNECDNLNALPPLTI